MPFGSPLGGPRRPQRSSRKHREASETSPKAAKNIDVCMVFDEFRKEVHFRGDADPKERHKDATTVWKRVSEGPKFWGFAEVTFWNNWDQQKQQSVWVPPFRDTNNVKRWSLFLAPVLASIFRACPQTLTEATQAPQEGLQPFVCYGVGAVRSFSST